MFDRSNVLSDIFLVLFVLSESYYQSLSDNRSDGVRRGNKNRIECCCLYQPLISYLSSTGLPTPIDSVSLLLVHILLRLTSADQTAECFTLYLWSDG